MNNQKYIESLSVTHPELCLEWSEKNEGFTPDMFTAGSHDYIWWKGACGHEWRAAINNRTTNRTGCPYCKHIKVLKGFNDFATIRPDLVSEWSDRNLPITPDMIMAHSGKYYWWKCNNGHEWRTTPANRMRGNNCPICGNKIILKGFNDIGTLRPDLAAIWSDKNYPLTPENTRPTYTKLLWWKCPDCGNDYQKRITYLDRGYKCPYCSLLKAKKGANDLTVTHPELASAWNYELNEGWRPEMLTKRSGRYSWWKCPYGHSFGMKISEINSPEDCPTCKAEYRVAFPLLWFVHCAQDDKLPMIFNYTDSDGTYYDIYLPDYKIAVEHAGVSAMKQKKQEEKKRICAEKGIRYYILSKMKNEEDSVEEVNRIFQDISCGTKLYTKTDGIYIREQFNEIRRMLCEEKRLKQ